jgi:signal transduction histidine kinase/CheY-like chemotaxis protein
MGRPRAFALLLGGLAAVAGLVVLSVAVVQSQERAEDDVIARFAERGTLAAQQIAGSTQVSSARQGADAQVRLSGEATEEALDAWEGEADPGIPYTALYDRSGRLLAVHPSDAGPVSDESGRRALQLATRGQPSTSGVVSSADGPVIEAFVPFPAEDGLRVLVIGQPQEIVAQFAAASVEDAAGVAGGAGYVTDRAGTLIAAVGEGARARAPQVSEAVRRRRTNSELDDQSLVVRRVQGTGLVVALTAPMDELTEDLPSTLGPRLALGGFALALLAVFWLTGRSVRDARRLEGARRTAEQAGRMAHEANVAKSEFLSRMSHELRTPLNAVLGFGQLLQLEDLAPDQRESAAQVVKGGRRLLELIDEVLDISRIESGTLLLSLEPVPVEDVVRDAVDLIRPLAEARAIRLRTELPSDVGTLHVTADRQRLGQVVLNLLSNAVKYNVENGTVSVTVVSAGADRIRMGVTDTGPGIPEDKIALLFTPFERLGAEQSNVEGTGLGLTLSKSLIEAMGGSLDVDTMTGEGATFWADLERAEAPTDERQAPRPEVPRPAVVSGKVLYIEDNLSNLRLIERLLSDRPDLELIPAMTGTLGIELAQQHGPDLILIDLHLPDLRGDEVVIRLRKDPRTRTIPLVILSADATQGQIERLRAAGADEYLTKPIDVVQFVAVVDRLLGSP